MNPMLPMVAALASSGNPAKNRRKGKSRMERIVEEATRRSMGVRSSEEKPGSDSAQEEV